MRNGTRLKVTCGRCGQERQLVGHVCAVSSGRAARRSATPKLKLDFGKCPKCKKRITNPLTHVCAPKSDFKRRKRKAEQAKAKPKKQPRDQHDYQLCRDDTCRRPMCTAFKVGYRRGYQEGFKDGYRLGYEQGYADGFAAGKAAGIKEGYEQGFKAGMAACPGPHGGK